MFSFALRTSWVVRSHVRCSKYGSESTKCTNKDAEGLPLHIQTVKDLKNICFSVFAIAGLFGVFLQWE